MSSPLMNNPAADTFDVEDLVTQAWRGQIRVPHFQRDFRWGWEDVRRLFDSILKGYPLGSLLLWSREAPDGPVKLGSLSIEAPKNEKAFWVVDGQQRLTSLANALHPTAGHEPQFALSFDLRKDIFVKPSKIFDPFIIPLPYLFDLQQVILWFAENPTAAAQLGNATRVTKILRQYEIPVYIVETEEVSVLQDIFDRMNNYGKRLTRAEIFTALNATSEQYGNDDLTLDGISAGIDAVYRFGRIDNDTILACVLARRAAEVRRDIRREFESPDDEGLANAYSRGEDAIRRAVAFLQSEADVPHYTLVPYHYLLVVLTRMFALHPDPSPRNVRLLRRWFWQAALAGPEQFRGGTPNAARILCGRIDQDESQSVQRLLRSTASDTTSTGGLTRFAPNEAATKILLCAMWSLHPRDFVSGEEYGLSDLADALQDSRTAQPGVRRLLARSAVPEDMRTWAANRAIMPNLTLDDAELWTALVQQPLSINERQWTSVLESQSVSASMREALADREIALFVAARQTALTELLSAFLAQRAEQQIENTPPLASLDLDSDD